MLDTKSEVILINYRAYFISLNVLWTCASFATAVFQGKKIALKIANSSFSSASSGDCPHVLYRIIAVDPARSSTKFFGYTPWY